MGLLLDGEMPNTNSGKITVYGLLVFNLSTPKGGESVDG